MITALQSGRGAPFEFVEMQLCREFHCLPSDLVNESWEKIELFLEIMNIESQFRDKEQRKLESKSKRRVPK